MIFHLGDKLEPFMVNCGSEVSRGEAKISKYNDTLVVSVVTSHMSV